MLPCAAVPAPQSILDSIDRRFDVTIEELIDLARIPSVSAAGFDPVEVERSAEHVAELFSDVGLRCVEILRIEGAHPYVTAEWLDAGPDAPTALIYAHHDVQPPGRLEHWQTPAFEPTRQADGRLYGRGVVDDKAGAPTTATLSPALISRSTPCKIDSFPSEVPTSLPRFSARRICVVMKPLYVVFVLAGLGAGADASTEASELARSGNRTILVVGDSISAGLGIQREQGWVHLLGDRLDATHPGIDVVNASISGDTTSGGVVRLPRALDTHAPDIVIIELGGNDGLRGYPIEKIRANLIDMVEMVHARGGAALLVGMQIPPNYGPRYVGAFRRVFEEVAEMTDSPLVPFLLVGVATDAALMQRDGIHPKADAQPILLDNVWPVLEPLLTFELMR